MSTYYVELTDDKTIKLEAENKEEVLEIYPDAKAIYLQLELDLEI